MLVNYHANTHPGAKLSFPNQGKNFGTFHYIYFSASQGRFLALSQNFLLLIVKLCNCLPKQVCVAY